MKHTDLEIGWLRRMVRALWWMNDCSVSADCWRMNREDLVRLHGHLLKRPLSREVVDQCEREMARTSVLDGRG